MSTLMVKLLRLDSYQFERCEKCRPISTLTSDLFLVYPVFLLCFQRRPTHCLAGEKGINDAIGVVAAQLRRENVAWPGSSTSNSSARH